MKIIILGAGQVGANLAENLVAEKNDITVVDLDTTRLGLLQDRFDLRPCAATRRMRRFSSRPAWTTPTCWWR
jgi:nucleoside-diphosphate-sugar epimerase